MHRIATWIQLVLVPALGPIGLFAVAFLDSSFLSLPEINDLLVVSAGAAQPERVWLPITMATLGSLAGCGVLWWIGRRGGEALLVRRVGRERAEQARNAFHRWGILAVAVPAVLPPPMPFKIFVLAAGVFGFGFRRFALTVLLSRGLRYTGWGLLGVLYGEVALRWLKTVDQWSSDRSQLLMGIAGLLLVLGVSAYLLRRRGRGDPHASEAR